MAEPGKAGPLSKAGKSQFVTGDDGKTCQRDWQGVSDEKRDTEQRHRKQDELDWNSKTARLVQSIPPRFLSRANHSRLLIQQIVPLGWR